MHSKGWIKNSNMELLRVDNIMNHYAKEHGKGFDRVSLQDMESRAERYDQLSKDLIEKKPESITLRVKSETDESGNTRGHTISLHRLPNGTYKVVDTSQPSINGTIFDPDNLEESPLGRNDKKNPYYDKLPKAYDYVK
jgi:ribosomal protein L29